MCSHASCVVRSSRTETVIPCPGFLCAFAPLRENVFVTQRREDAKGAIEPLGTHHLLTARSHRGHTNSSEPSIEPLGDTPPFDSDSSSISPNAYPGNPM